MKVCSIGLVLSCLMICAAGVIAADIDPEALRKAVAESTDRFEKAAAARDAKAVGALFTLEAEYINSEGVIFHGREAIEAEFAAIYSIAVEGAVEVEVISIRPIAAGVLAEDGVSTFTPKAEGQSRRTRYTATHVKQADGKWLLASVRELDDAVTTPHEHLKELSWLTGKWLEESDGSSVSTEWSWSESGNYLVSKFSIRDKDGDVLAGAHRVGWDAERQQFRSWLFEEAGGFAEGHWTAEPDGTWAVHLSGVSPDGVRLGARLNYARDGADAIVLTETVRTHGGTNLPDVSRRVVRQPPAPNKAAVPAPAKRAAPAKSAAPAKAPAK